MTLSQEERQHLQALVKRGNAAARTRLHAQVLLKADTEEEGWTDEAISRALDVHPTTVANVRQRLVAEGMETARARRRARTVGRRKLDGKQEAHLIALTCSNPPHGQGRWSLRLLADTLVELRVVDTISYETVRQVLKKTHSSPG